MSDFLRLVADVDVVAIRLLSKTAATTPAFESSSCCVGLFPLVGWCFWKHVLLSLNIITMKIPSRVKSHPFGRKLKEEEENLIEDHLNHQEEEGEEEGWGKKAAIRSQLSSQKKNAKVAVLKKKLTEKIEALKKKRMGRKYEEEKKEPSKNGKGDKTPKKTPRKKEGKTPASKKKESKKARREKNQKKQPRGEKAKERSIMKHQIKLLRGGKGGRQPLLNDDSD